MFFILRDGVWASKKGLRVSVRGVPASIEEFYGHQKGCAGTYALSR